MWKTIFKVYGGSCLNCLLMPNVAMWLSRNPRSKYIVSVKSCCKHLDNTLIQRSDFNNFWFFKLACFVFSLESNKHARNYLQRKTFSAQSTYLELHTLYPYENSDGCSPAEGNAPLKVLLYEIE